MMVKNSIVPLHTASEVAELLIYPTTHTNENGTFSPALMMQGVLFVDRKWQHKSEDPMADLATTHFYQLRQMVRREVTQVGYTEIKDIVKLTQG